jgi:hypothetical protein
VNIKLSLYVKYWTWFMAFCFLVLSFLVYFAYVFISDDFESFLIYKSADEIFKSADFYLIVIFNTSLLFVMDYAIMYYTTTYQTTIGHYFQYLIKTGREDEVDSFQIFERKQGNDDVDYNQPKTPVMVRPVARKEKDIEN